MGELAERVAAFIDAKNKEQVAREYRIELEEQIADLIPGPDSGSKTVTLDDGTKVTVKRGYNYRADCVEIEKMCDVSRVIPPVKEKTTRELDVAGYEYYREHDSELFNKLSQFVAVTPKKVAVEVKRK